MIFMDLIHELEADSVEIQGMSGIGHVNDSVHVDF